MQENGTKSYFSELRQARQDIAYYENVNTAVVLAKQYVPLKHKQLAKNYVLIKKIFGSSIVAIPITSSDRAVLFRHGFLPLEHSTIAQVNRQIEQLKNWSNSGDILLNTYANELFEIRIKELKYIRLTTSMRRSLEFENGYLALEKYVEYIAN